MIDIFDYDNDYFTFTAAETGIINFTATASGLSMINIDWLTAGIDDAKADFNLLSFEVNAGENYTLGISSSHAYGHYKINVNYGEAQKDVVAYEGTTIKTLTMTDIFGTVSNMDFDINVNSEASLSTLNFGESDLISLSTLQNNHHHFQLEQTL